MIDSDQEGNFHDEEAKKSPKTKKRAKKPAHLEPQDHELLSILRIDEEQYFAEVDKRFRTQLYAYLRRQAQAKSGFTHDDVEDLGQTTLTRFYIWIQNQKKVSETIELNHKAYLLAIARNVYLDEIQNRTKHSTVTLDNPISNRGENTNATIADQLPDPHSLDEQELKIFLDTVRDRIEQLREPYRTVMRHIAVDGMSEKEIIDRLRVNPNTGKAWVRRGRKMLKDALPEYEDYL